jgi:hypothetical protein
MKTKNDCFRVIRHPLKEGWRMRNSDNCNFSHRISETKQIKHGHESPYVYKDPKVTISAMSQRQSNVHRKRVKLRHQ